MKFSQKIRVSSLYELHFSKSQLLLTYTNSSNHLVTRLIILRNHSVYAIKASLKGKEILMKVLLKYFLWLCQGTFYFFEIHFCQTYLQIISTCDPILPISTIKQIIKCKKQSFNRLQVLSLMNSCVRASNLIYQQYLQPKFCLC